MSSICPISGETDKEERLNHFTHRVGLWLSAVGVPLLIFYSYLYGDPLHVAGYVIYGFTLILLYVASTCYHGCRSIQLKRSFRVLDHTCIYLLIAGSYTPFTLGPLRDCGGWLIMGIEWGIALIGILLKIFAFHRFQVVSLIAYLAMGWFVVFSWGTLAEKLPPLPINLLLACGLSYTIGVVFFLWKRLPYAHAVWHLFVLGGSICHYFAVLLLLVK